MSENEAVYEIFVKSDGKVSDPSLENSNSWPEDEEAVEEFLPKKSPGRKAGFKASENSCEKISQGVRDSWPNRRITIQKKNEIMKMVDKIGFIYSLKLSDKRYTLKNDDMPDEMKQLYDVLKKIPHGIAMVIGRFNALTGVGYDGVPNKKIAKAFHKKIFKEIKTNFPQYVESFVLSEKEETVIESAIKKVEEEYGL